MKQKHHNLARRVAAERTKLGLSLRGLADLTGVSHNTISRIEEGGDVLLSTLLFVLSALDIKPTEVLE